MAESIKFKKTLFNTYCQLLQSIENLAEKSNSRKVSIIRKCVGMPTGSKVDDEVSQKDSIADAVEDDPVSAEIVVKERDGDGQRDHVSQQQYQHHQIPVESASANVLEPFVIVT